MSKLKVNEIEANTASQVTVKSAITTEQGISNTGGSVSLGTQTAFRSQGIDDNATQVRLTLQESTPNLDVTGDLTASGTVAASAMTVNGVGVGAQVKSSGTVSVGGQVTDAGVVTMTVSNAAFVGTPFNASGISNTASQIVVTFASSDFNGANAIPMLMVHNATNTAANTAVMIKSVAMTDTTMTFDFEASNASGSTGTFSTMKINFFILA